MVNETVKIPDLGGVDEVVVLEVLIKVGDSVTTDQPLMSLESEKASMDVPSDRDGKVTAILLQVGDKVREGDACISVEANNSAPKPETPPETSDAEAAAVAPQPLPRLGRLHPWRVEVQVGSSSQGRPTAAAR